jgi:hypothetical protein
MKVHTIRLHKPFLICKFCFRISCSPVPTSYVTPVLEILEGRKSQ